MNDFQIFVICISAVSGVGLVGLITWAIVDATAKAC